MPQVLLDLPDDLLLALREQPEEVLHEVRLIAASITCRQNVCRSGRRHCWQEYPGWISSISWLRVVFRLSTSQPRMPWPKLLRHSAPPPMIVSNATPLLAFARIDALELLALIVRHILIPETVWHEVTRDS